MPVTILAPAFRRAVFAPTVYRGFTTSAAANKTLKDTVKDAAGTVSIHPQLWLTLGRGEGQQSSLDGADQARRRGAPRGRQGCGRGRGHGEDGEGCR